MSTDLTGLPENPFDDDQWNVLPQKGVQFSDIDQLRRDYHSSKLVNQLCDEIVLLRGGLEASLKLQSHYADLLNMYDGGKRMKFFNALEWLKRITKLGGA